MNTEIQTSPEAVEFDERFLHNFGPINPVSKGTVALCGVISRRTSFGIIKPKLSECCPICLALTEDANDRPS